MFCTLLYRFTFVNPLAVSFPFLFGCLVQEFFFIYLVIGPEGFRPCRQGYVSCGTTCHMDVMHMMAAGAQAMVDFGETHTAKHSAVGFSRADWDLLRQPEPWSPAERRRVKSVLSEACNLTLELSGLPAEPLPGQYVAAVIVRLVRPANWLVACHRAPETYDAVSASGLVGPSDIRPWTVEEMISLVMAYASGRFLDRSGGWSTELKDEAVAAAESA